MKEELFVIIDGERKQLDLNTPSGITLNFKTRLFEPEVMKPDYSYTFTLPYSEVNRKVFNACDDVRVKSATNRFKAEYYINGVFMFRDCDLYIDKSDTQLGFDANIIFNGVVRKTTFFEDEVSLRDLGDYLTTDYENSEFGEEERDRVIRPKLFKTNSSVLSEEVVYAEESTSSEWPLGSYEELENTPYLEPIYGAGAAIFENATITVQQGGKSYIRYTPFSNGYDDKDLGLYERSKGRSTFPLCSPVVAPLPYLIKCISEVFGIKIILPEERMKDFCLPFVKMGQTKCLQQQNFLNIDILGAIKDSAYPDAEDDDKGRMSILWGIGDSHSQFADYSIKAQRIGAEYREENSGFWGGLLSSIAGFFALGVVGAATGYIVGKKLTESTDTVGRKTGIAVVVSSGLGCKLHLYGRIKLKVIYPPSHDGVSAANSDASVLPKLTLYRFPIPSEWLSRDGFDFSNENHAIINPVHSWAESVEGRTSIEITPILTKISSVIEKGNFYPTTTLEYEYNLCPENGGEDIILSGDAGMLSSVNLAMLYANADISGFHSYSGMEIESENLKIYWGNSENISPSNLGGVINYFKNLPDISCQELIKDIAIVLNGGYIYDIEKNALKFLGFEDLYKNLFSESIKNWDSRLLFKDSENDIVTGHSLFTSEIPRKRFYLMANEKIDSKGILEKQANDADWYRQNGAFLDFGSELNSNEIETVSVSFYGAFISSKTSRGKDTGGTTNFWTYHAALDGNILSDVKINETKPILGEYCWRSASKSLKKYYLSISTWQFPADLKDLKSYRYMSDCLVNARIIEEYMELSEFDLRDLDYTVPVYLDKYSSYFGIIDIERYDDGICKVIMFKLPFEEDYTIKYEPYILIMPKQGGYDYAWDDEVWVVLKIKAYYYKQGETEPFKSFNVDLAEDDIKVIFDHKYGEEEWYWDKERHTVVLTANPEAEQSYHVQMFFEVNIQGEVLDLSDKAVSYNRLYQQ